MFGYLKRRQKKRNFKKIQEANGRSINATIY
jgi:hypothetical protein